MFSNYLRTTLRNLWWNRGYAATNITGLALGIAVCLVILLYVQMELSFDRFNERGDQIYRVIYAPAWSGVERSPSIYTPTILAPLLRREVPEVESAVRFFDSFGSVLVSSGDRVFEEDRFFYADSTLFSIFSLALREGDPSAALRRPFTVVLSRSMALKYFGTESVVGRTITLNNRQPFEITGVMSDIPRTSQIQFDFVASFVSLSRWAHKEMWDTANFSTYLLLRKGTPLQSVERKVESMLKRAIQVSSPFATFDAGVLLEPLFDVYLHSPFTLRNQPDGSWTTVLILSAIAVLILITACINYMNLSTARSQRRAREIGIRKTVGARTGQIAVQFFIESGLIALAAVLVAIVIAEVTLPSVNELLGRHLELNYLRNPLLLVPLVVIWLVVTLVSGSYPAVFMAFVKPATILKPLSRAPWAAGGMRRLLVVLQFAISFILVTGTMVLFNQLHFIRAKELGFDKEQFLVFRISDARTVQKLSTIHSELSRMPGVVGATTTEVPLVNVTSGYSIWREGTAEGHAPTVNAFATDHRFIKTLGIPLLAGSALPEVHPQDSSWHFVLNESAARELGWTPDEAVGQPVTLSGRKGIVVGVMKDFHYRSLHEQIGPLVIFNSNKAGYTEDVGYLMVRIAPGQLRSSIASLQAMWRELVPHRPFRFTFLDADIDGVYRSEQRVGWLLGVFTGLAIFIACLGLFALAAFMAEQRTNEIGIRKVLGASVSAIIGLLSKDFLKLITVGLLVGGPIAYAASLLWLQDFAYRIQLNWMYFFVSALLTLAIAMATISYQATRAALANPAQSLKYE
jgi:putative ABC transport system permease protein